MGECAALHIIMTFNEFEAKIPERDIWDNLKKINKPIVMYGMGNGADKICSVLDTFGIQVADFFASDGFVRGQTFHQKTVKRYSEICSEYRDFVILVSFGSRLESVISYINDLSRTPEL